MPELEKVTMGMGIKLLGIRLTFPHLGKMLHLPILFLVVAPGVAGAAHPQAPSRSPSTSAPFPVAVACTRLDVPLVCALEGSTGSPLPLGPPAQWMGDRLITAAQKL